MEHLDMEEKSKQTDPLKLLSYSSTLLLHECPRKFELYRLSAKHDDIKGNSEEQELTFGFGHMVGEGIQLVLSNIPMEVITFHMFMRWKQDLDFYDEKGNKSFYLAMFAIEKFKAMIDSQLLLQEYELVYLGEKPACEVSFKILLHKGYVFRGSIDVILRNKVTGKYLILEVKTTKMENINPIIYKNSSQAAGYSVILDYLAGEQASYDVMYLVYKTRKYEYEVFIFPKNAMHKAQWISDTVLEVNKIELYKEYSFPLHGENCINKFYRECEYVNVCTLATSHLVGQSKCAATKGSDTEKRSEDDYDYVITLEDVIQGQLASKGEQHDLLGN